MVFDVVVMVVALSRLMDRSDEKKNIIQNS